MSSHATPVGQMQIETRDWSPARGWSAGLPSELDSDQTLVLAFCAPDPEEMRAPLEQLSRAFPLAKVVGCATAGEINGTKLQTGSAVVSVVRFAGTALRTASSLVGTREDSFDAGCRIAESLSSPDLRAVFVLADGLKINGAALVRGIHSTVPSGVVISGGLSGDGEDFKRTWVLVDRTPVPGAVTAVGLYGDRIRVGYGSKGGWDVFGPERVVTKSSGSVLYELDGKPALPLYKKYLGERSNDLPASALLFPLALRRRREDTEYLVRSVMGIDEKTQSMTFAGDIPEGHLAQLMRANFDRLIEGAAEAGAACRLGVETGGPTLAVAVSCVGRRVVLGERTEEELERTLEVLPEGAQQIGFYSYGEISPFLSGGCDLHNQTMTLTTFAEA